MSDKKIVLTGDRTSGPLHIGHYFGSLLNRKELEKEHEVYIMAADVQTLTDNFDNPEKVRANAFETITDNLALGLDMSKTTLFIQSQIPQIAELTVYFSNLVTLNRLLRNPTVKTEIAQKKELFGNDGESVNYGFVGYPVSQAADILFLRSEIIPVGEDQLPVIEVCREIADKFNSIYEPIFKLPEARLSEGKRILGLNGGSKMSKSLGNAIYLKDSEEETIKKLKSATTDSFSTIDYDPTTRPEISNLVMIYSLVNEISIEDAVRDLQGVRYGDFKLKLGADLNSYFREFRLRRKEIEANPQYIRDMLEQGRQRVEVRAIETMDMVRKAMRIDY
jgi:tryptophanyl-tRNA synthetase